MLFIIFALQINQEQGVTSDWKVTSEGRGHRKRERESRARREENTFRTIQEAASLEVIM